MTEQATLSRKGGQCSASHIVCEKDSTRCEWRCTDVHKITKKVTHCPDKKLKHYSSDAA